MKKRSGYFEISKDMLKYGSIIYKAVCILAFAFSLLTVIWFIFSDRMPIYNSDFSDSLLWSYASLLSKKPLSPDFYYPYFLPYGGNIIFMIPVMLFGVSLTAQRLGLLIFLVLSVFAYYLLFKSFPMSVYERLAAIAFVLTVSVSGEIMRENWTHILYNNLSVLLFAFLVSFITRYNEDGRKYLILSAVITGLAVANGTSVLSLVLLPLIIMFFVEIYFFGRLTKLFEVAKYNGIGALVGAILYLLSTGFGRIETTGYEKMFVRFSSSAEWMDHFKKIFTHWLYLFGVVGTEKIDYVSRSGIIIAVSTLACAFTVILPFIAIFRIKKLDFRERMTEVMYISMAAIIFFGYICGIFWTSERRLIPVVMIASLVTGLIVFGNGTAVVSFKRKNLIKIFLILFVFLKLTSFIYDQFHYVRDDRQVVLAQFLEDNDLEFGGADYWDAASTTLYSGGKTVVAPMVYFDPNTGEENLLNYRYNTFKKWCDRAENEGVEFLVVRNEDVDRMSDAFKEEFFTGGTALDVPGTSYKVIVYETPKKIERSWILKENID